MDERYNEIKQGFDRVRSEYMGLEDGYNNRQHLQQIRKELTDLYADCLDIISKSKYNRVYSEHERHIVLARLTLSFNGSMASADRDARASTEYEEFVDEMASYHADWEVVRHLKDSILQYIYTLASHIDSIKEPLH